MDDSDRHVERALRAVRPVFVRAAGAVSPGAMHERVLARIGTASERVRAVEARIQLIAAAAVVAVIVATVVAGTHLVNQAVLAGLADLGEPVALGAPLSLGWR